MSAASNKTGCGNRVAVATRPINRHRPSRRSVANLGSILGSSCRRQDRPLSYSSYPACNNFHQWDRSINKQQDVNWHSDPRSWRIRTGRYELPHLSFLTFLAWGRTSLTSCVSRTSPSGPRLSALYFEGHLLALEGRRTTHQSGRRHRVVL